MAGFEQFLKQQGAIFDARGVLAFPSHQSTSDTTLAVLSHLQCLWVEGAEAAKFLQGQLTCHVNEIQAPDSHFGHWRPGAHCNTKGRMIFDFLALSTHNRSQPAIGLIVEAGLLDNAQTALKKYMVFSKAELRSEERLVAIGLNGPDAAMCLQQLVETDIPSEPGQVHAGDYGFTLSLSPHRYLCLLDSDSLSQLWPQWVEGCHLGGQFEWDLADIEAGIGHVRAETSEAFIPQDLNFQLTGGINFQKGCYIGQEVVARMQYRGKLKRHMRRASIHLPQWQSPPTPGSSLYTDDKEQSIGTVVQAAPRGPDTFEMLAVVTDQCFEADRVFLNQQTTQKLQFLSLPYAITK